ncbi:similar to Saccharomyces cerevisiae YHR211W FLO5 Lectin-like cell wall protein (flocculin) involved in flocculation [Maudiozyma saulgeensis]|uniref:Similar to Saccharomyces cerevisiae YHR211W FLO5 Lectin-like cell wall protein (Flocculin) involved in flocculation n=1 Tax=Maudiozyma saulgeensis TaxID=1789683 RepID=A0A1X7R8P8_9SACH|nr:similar to Saccharomyces cerevisiae YHR211W FLO5 Lectin-like cell wall protein (flocculin) involved in flocculation [Kazachstania saulgeensis]
MTIFSCFSGIQAQLLTSLLLLSTVVVQTTNAAEGCKPQSSGTLGFDMSLYHYPFDESSPSSCYSNYYQTDEFQHGGYESFGGGLFGTATDIEDVTLNLRLNAHCREIMGTLPDNFHYADTMSVSNFTMLLTGYFLADDSGQYTFTVVADDLAYLSFGAGNAFECCDEEGTVSDPEAFDLIVTWKSDNDMSGSVSYNLEAGVFYPIRLLYANRDYHGTLELSYEDPNGGVHTDFTEHIYQFPDEPEGCPNNIHTSTTYWTGSYTSTFTTSVYTTTGTDGHATTETVYIVETPDDRTYISTATTEYTQGTADVTTTYSTATGVVTGTDGIITTETTFFVETPTSRSKTATATTEYTQGTADVTTTYSTATGVTTGTDGVITTETTFFVETPTSRSETATATTEYTQGTADVTTTYSTATGVVTGTDGVITTETTFFVETPTSRSKTATATTVFTEGTADVTTTYSTGTGVYTGSDGVVTTRTTFYVEEPRPETTITTVHTTTIYTSVTVPTTVTHVTTYTTTDGDGDEEEIVSTDIEIEIPSIEESTTVVKTTTIYTSVTAPTTVTHVTTYYTTDSDGEEEEVVSTDVEIEIPSIDETVTTASTVYTPGQVTVTTTIRTIVTTYLTTDSDGNEDEIVETDYVVEIPDVSKTIETVTTESTDYPGSVTTTLTHVTTYFTTDADGNEEEVIKTDIIIETPRNPNTVVEVTCTPSTIFTYCTCSETSTYSTNIKTFTTTDVNGNPGEVTKTDYYVAIPKPTTDAYEHPLEESAAVTTISESATNKPAVTETSQNIPAITEYSSQTSSSTTANITEYSGVGAVASNSILTFVIGLFFANLLI